jgi:hypothetical protein
MVSRCLMLDAALALITPLFCTALETAICPLVLPAAIKEATTMNPPDSR